MRGFSEASLQTTRPRTTRPRSFQKLDLLATRHQHDGPVARGRLETPTRPNPSKIRFTCSQLGPATRTTHFYLRGLLRNGGVFYASPVFVTVRKYINCETQKSIMKPTLTLLTALLLAPLAALHAADVFARDYRALPTVARARLAWAVEPDAQGMIGFNRKRWDGAGNQRSGVLALMEAAIEGDQKRFDRCWPLVTVTFDHMQPDGLIEARYEDGRLRKRKDCFADSLFWMSHLGWALRVVEGSPLAEFAKPKITSLQPLIARHAAFMREAGEYLLLHDAGCPNRLFIYATACGLVGERMNDGPLRDLGSRLAQRGLALQRKDGVFPEHGGFDTGYQCVSIQFLQLYLRAFPNETGEKALTCAVAVELPRIAPNGEVGAEGNTRTGVSKEAYYGRPKGINYQSVFLGLGLYAVIHNDDAARAAAVRADAFYWSKRRQPPLKANDR